MMVFDNGNTQITTGEDKVYTQPQLHETVDHKFGVTFLGQVVRKIYFFSDRPYYQTSYSYTPHTPSGKDDDIYIKNEFAKYRPIHTAIFKSPLFREGDKVFVPQVNKSARITGIERSIEDGSYRIYVDAEVDVIEDNETEKSLQKAIEDKKQYVKYMEDQKKEQDEQEKHEKAVIEHVKKRDGWNKQHNIIYKLFKQNPYQYDELVMEYDKKIEDEQQKNKHLYR